MLVISSFVLGDALLEVRLCSNHAGPFSHYEADEIQS